MCRSLRPTLSVLHRMADALLRPRHLGSQAFPIMKHHDKPAEMLSEFTSLMANAHFLLPYLPITIHNSYGAGYTDLFLHYLQPM